MPGPAGEKPRRDLLRRNLLRGVSIFVVTGSLEDDKGAFESDGQAVFETCSGLGAGVRAHRASGGDIALTDAPGGPDALGGRDAPGGRDESAGPAARGGPDALGGRDAPGGRDESAGPAAPVNQEVPADSDVPGPAAETNVLVVDGHALFAAAGLDGCLDGAWQATQAVVNRAFLAATDKQPVGGRIVYLAPRPGAGPEADAARAGLENLARTLSIEWARYGITVVTIAPGDSTAPGEAATLAAYLASPAGAYFSGCQLDLRGP